MILSVLNFSDVWIFRMFFTTHILWNHSYKSNLWKAISVWANPLPRAERGMLFCCGGIPPLGDRRWDVQIYPTRLVLYYSNNWIDSINWIKSIPGHSPGQPSWGIAYGSHICIYPLRIYKTAVTHWLTKYVISRIDRLLGRPGAKPVNRAAIAYEAANASWGILIAHFDNGFASFTGNWQLIDAAVNSLSLTLKV